MKKLFYPVCISVFILLCVGQKSSAQATFEPIFEDADGKTAIIAPRGFFGINTANSSVRFQYFYSRSAAADPTDRRLIGKWNRFYAGVNVTGAAAGGLSNLFSSGDFNPGTSADLFLGHRSLFFGTVDRNDRTGETIKNYSNRPGGTLTVQDWLTFRTGVQAANYKLYDPSRVFNQQISTENFRGYLAQLAYTVLINGATSIGVSADVAKVNNIDYLSSLKVHQQTTTTSPSGGTTRTFEQEFNAFVGGYKTEVVNNFNVDIVQQLTQNETRYAFHFYGRLQRNDSDNIYKSGLGFYVFPKGKIFGGVFVESNDLTNKIGASSSLLKRMNIGVTVKYVLPALGGSAE